MSKTYIGVIVIVAGWLGLGDIFSGETTPAIVNNVLELIGVITAIYGRYKAGGITLFGVKK